MITDDDEEVRLIDELNAAREELFQLMTPEERETKRRYGSTYPITFEDVARALIQGEEDPRQLNLTLALNEFTAALNAILEYVFKGDIHETLAKSWTQRRNLRLDEACTTMEDAASEAMFQIRHALSRACPQKHKLFSYCWPVVFRALDVWWGRQQAPVEMPVHVARIRTGRPTRVQIDRITRREDLAPEEDEDG